MVSMSKTQEADRMRRRECAIYAVPAAVAVATRNVTTGDLTLQYRHLVSIPCHFTVSEVVDFGHLVGAVLTGGFLI